MSAPLVVNTKDGACWTRRTVTEGGVALYALAGVCQCPEFVMATLAELAERGIVGSADALPVPVGPQMPDFPPPPQTELEKLHAERARLQDLLADAVRDAHLARRERDLMRERVSEPYGCAYCGTPKRFHGRRYISGAGMHGWERPSDEQVKDRMLARRVARMVLPSNLSLWEEEPTTAELRARVAELEAQREALAERLRAGQRWERGRNPELVSENFVSQSELRSIFGIPLVAPWDESPADEPDFFQPGHTYAYDSDGFTAPELVTLFRVVADTVHPDTSKRMAFGWLRVGEEQTWTPYAEPADEWPGRWTDVTRGGDE